jgi:hypothetical protein
MVALLLVQERSFGVASSCWLERLCVSVMKVRRKRNWQDGRPSEGIYAFRLALRGDFI